MFLGFFFYSLVFRPPWSKNYIIDAIGGGPVFALRGEIIGLLIPHSSLFFHLTVGVGTFAWTVHSLRLSTALHDQVLSGGGVVSLALQPTGV